MKKKLPLVSVIINCFNGEKYLNDCINSVINQTYKNWEIIFWNNCSTDNSIKIIKKFNDKRIKIYQARFFSNLYKSRNLAIKKSRGKYVAFLDTDDTWTKDKLEIQIKEIQQDKLIKIIYSNYFILLDNKKKKYIRHIKHLPSGRITTKLLKSYDIGIITSLIHKDIFKKKLFNGSYNIIGDFDFFLNTSLKYKIKAIQKPLATYRVHDENYSKKSNNLYLLEMYLWFKKNHNKRLFKKYSFFYLKILILKLAVKVFFKKFLGLNLGV